MGSGLRWCLITVSAHSSLSLWRLGTLFFGSKCFFQGQFPSSAQYMLCAQGMQINLMLALANPARKVNLIL